MTTSRWLLATQAKTRSRTNPGWRITVRFRGGALKVLIETDTDEIHEELKADARGRITLGKEYAGEIVTVAVVEKDEK